MGDDQDIFLSELFVTGGSPHWQQLQWELFIFHDVRGVLPTRDRDRVVIVHRSRAEPERWLQALRDAGLNRGGVPRP
jgi:hypothetical protein